ncbi:hypothetical protein ANTHELSMS3_00017 [Antarctobacter heliothermus]|uniref:Uncharacterized protein n=1 Tax=Antarctobacter heliothermus TaxID=74033 RepID=A0A222DXT9_9RHOB|nr:hypothetical protein [Antarctobacter heliothermus]ASP18743.1 hypothetical protein ANTHELSMS3_00017 [Antarctobacter heliothermus]
MALLNITRWPTILIFIFAGIAAATFAFVTVNLFSQAMASLDFLKAFGWEAIRHGALRQVVELAVWGALSLACWLSFKACEHVLEDRYLEWARRSRTSRRDTDR